MSSRIADSLAPRISRQVVKLRDRTLLEGAMAASALVAMADRRILLEEDLAVGAVLENVELLSIYDPELAVSLHSAYVDLLRTDYSAGKTRALDSIARCAGDIDAAELLVKVGIAVAKADAEFSSEEREMVSEICLKLGIEGLDVVGLAGLRPAPKLN